MKQLKDLVFIFNMTKHYFKRYFNNSNVFDEWEKIPKADVASVKGSLWIRRNKYGRHVSINSGGVCLHQTFFYEAGWRRKGEHGNRILLSSCDLVGSIIKSLKKLKLKQSARKKGRRLSLNAVL